MKIKILLLALCTLIVGQLNAQKNWRQHRKQAIETQKQLLERNMPNRNNTFSSFVQSRSTQEGEVWNKIASNAIPTDQEINSIKMVDENIVWMTSSPFLFGAPDGSNAMVHKSLDGGVTWQALPIPNTEGFFAADIAPIDANVAYASLWGPDFGNDISLDGLYQTKDGGSSWEKVQSYEFAPTYVHFFNEQQGWVYGIDESFAPVMSVTEDGGTTWSHAGGADWSIPEGRTLPEYDENEFISTFTFSLSSNYDVVGSTIIMGGTGYWISHDKGYTWERKASPLFEEDELVHGVVAMKDTQTYLFTSNLDLGFSFGQSTAYATTDGGQTWTKSIVPVNPSAAAYLPGTENDFIITGQDQGFNPSFGYGLTGTARTSDLGTWEMIDDKGLLSIDFVSENQGVGAFANYSGSQEAGNVYSWGTPILKDYDAITLATNDYPYTIIALQHLSEAVRYEYQIQNTGLNNLSSFELVMEIILDGVSIATEKEEIEIEQNNSKIIDLIYQPTEIGFYEFKITGSHPNLGAAFFQESRFLEVSPTILARDNGNVTLAYSLDPERSDFTYGYFGTEYELLVEDKLEALSVVIDYNLSDSASLFSFLIKEIDENGQVAEGNVYESAPLLASDFFTLDFSHVTYTLPEPITLSKGNYIFAVGQSEALGGIAFDLTSQTNFEAWWYSPVGFGGIPIPWTKIDDGTSPTLMLRAYFEDPMSTSTQETLLAENTPLIVFPVPFKNELNILLEYAEETEVNIQIFDMAGKQWNNFTTNHHQLINQNLSELPNGLYLLRLKSGLYQRSVKVLKQ